MKRASQPNPKLKTELTLLPHASPIAFPMRVEQQPAVDVMMLPFVGAAPLSPFGVMASSEGSSCSAEMTGVAEPYPSRLLGVVWAA
jgi:hypothetical protein